MTTGSTAFQVRMPSELHDALSAYAKAVGGSMNAVINDAVKAYLGSTARQREIERLVKKVQLDYRVALDKLADL